MDFTDYTATKLTSMQKRGNDAGHGTAREYQNDRRGASMPPVRKRTTEEVSAARIALAGLAMGKPEGEREVWLTEVLQMLGLHRSSK